MNPLKDFALFWTNYVNFSGRTPRRGFWFVQLWLFLIYLVLYMILVASGFSALDLALGGSGVGSLGGFTFVLMLILLFSLATILPSLSLTIRRLHDTGRRWYWILFPYIPVAVSVIGALVIAASAGGARSYSDIGSIVSGSAVFAIIVLILDLVVGIAWIVILALPTSADAIGESTHGDAPVSVSVGSPAGSLPGVRAEAQQAMVPQVPTAPTAFHKRSGSITGVSGMYRGATISMNPGEMVVLGRDSAVSHVVIDQGAAKVSRKHASLVFDPNNNTYYVHDHSSNGTFKSDGTRLAMDVDVALPAGTVIHLGSASNSFRLG